MNVAMRSLGRLQRIPALSGWKRYAVAIGFGAVAGFAFAPFRWPLALLVALSGLALLLEGSIGAMKPRRSAFFTGSAFGAAFFATTMAWLANAFLVQAEEFGWLIPIILPLFFAGLGLFFGLAGVIHVSLRLRFRASGLAAVLPLVAGLSTAEWLRGHILTGLPWNLFAQSMAGHLWTLQPLSVLGPYGYGVLVALLAVIPAAVILRPEAAKRGAALFGGVLAVILAFGGIRTALLPSEVRSDAQVVIVQPNVSQRDKLDPQKRRDGLMRSLEMTARAAAAAGEGRAVYAVWPENAYPLLDRIPDLPQVLARDLPENSYLVSGSIRTVEEGYANTLLVFGPTGSGARLLTAYDKHRLVPFGETLPFYSVFAFLGLETLSPAGGGGFIPGPGPTRIAAGTASFAPLICYEDVFPGTLYPRGERPDWLVVVTNDAWFGDSAGPMQHLDIARMRAVESGLPLARSANTGISALIDAEGRLVHSLPLYEPGVITTSLPVSRPPTLYSRTGDLIFVAMLILIVSMVPERGLQHRIAKSNLSVTERD